MSDFMKMTAATVAAGLLLSSAAQAQAPTPSPLGALGRNDRNNDQKLTPEEFMSSRPGVVKKIDTNGDKLLSTEEVTAFYVAIAPLDDPKTKSRINGIMAADADKNGKVTADELKASDMADFKKRDKNSDGVITVADM